jgi:hypothetical protein
MKSKVLQFLSIGLLAAPLAASAAVITQYGSRSAWDAAVGVNTVIDFEGLAPPGAYFGIPVPPGLTVSGVSFGTAAPTTGNDFILAGPVNYGPSSVLALYDAPGLGSTRTLNMLFPSAGYEGIAFDFAHTVTPMNVTVMLSTGDSFLAVAPSAPSPGFGFVGFTSSVAITEVSIIESRGGTNVLLLDNVSFGLPQAVIAEPATLALLSLGLVGLGFSRRQPS